MVGSATSAVTPIAMNTNGMVLIGSNGADPVAATLTAGSGITVTNGAGSISIASSATNRVVQTVYNNTTARATSSNAFPFDDTIPQIGEGAEILTCSITPTNASNVLLIIFTGNCSFASSSAFTVALFQDSTANALSANPVTNGAPNSPQVVLQHRMVAGTTSSTTFKIRMGGVGAAWTVNDGSLGTRVYGGVSSTTLTITEYSV